MRSLKTRYVLAASSIATVLVAAVAVVTWSPESRIDSKPSERVAGSHSGPVSVPDNRGPDVVDGFRGEVHPLLFGQTRLELTAHWSPIGQGRERLDLQIPADIYRVFQDLSVVEPRRTYTEKEFSAFLPPEVKQVGQLWTIDLDRVAPFLTQFHPNPRMRAVSRGRRAGPDGVFAVLRAVSPSHFDIVFRVHAEFQLGLNIWYAPAYFSGRMLVNRQSGTIEHFKLELPTDKTLNVHLTVLAVSDGRTPDIHREIKHGDQVVTARDIVHVSRMQLTDGNADLLEKLDWSDQMEFAQAEHALKKVFYKFMEIDWVPFGRAVAESRRTKKPIFAVVLWGGLDDQSC